MNILLINSSGRTGGNTGRVMSLFEDASGSKHIK